MVADAVDQYGPQPPAATLVELATAIGCTPEAAQFGEFMDAVQKFCGNGHAELVEAEFQKEPEAAAGGDQKEEEQGGEPPPEAEAAEEKSDEAEPGAAQEQEADPAALEQEGPGRRGGAARGNWREAPAVQDELAAQKDQEEAAAPDADEAQRGERRSGRCSAHRRSRER